VYVCGLAFKVSHPEFEIVAVEILTPRRPIPLSYQNVSNSDLKKSYLLAFTNWLHPNPENCPRCDEDVKTV
jgi:hypothetical protein